MRVKKILVIGAGVMGLGISQLAAQKGFQVFLKDINEEVIQNGIDRIEKNLQKIVSKGKISKEEMENCLSNINSLKDLQQVKEMDFIIEAVVEDTMTKKEVIKEIDQYRSDDTVFATNTTSLSVTELSIVMKNPNNFIGMHFFNPVWAMKLVEIIPGISTSKETIAVTREVTRLLDKIPVVAKESAGGIVSRILGAMLNEAIFVLAEGVASAEDIDTAMELGANLPIGPLHLLDLIGLDVHLAKMETFYKEFGDPKYRPHPLLRKMVRSSYLGKKSGKGFFKYFNFQEKNS